MDWKRILVKHSRKPEILICLDGDSGEYFEREFKRLRTNPKLFQRPIDFLMEAQTASYDAFFIDLQNEFGEARYRNPFGPDANDLAGKIMDIQAGKPIIALSAIGKEIKLEEIQNFNDILPTYFRNESILTAFPRELRKILIKYNLIEK